MTQKSRESSEAKPTDTSAQSPSVPDCSHANGKAPTELFRNRRLQNLAGKHRIRTITLRRLTKGPFKRWEIYCRQVAQEDRSKWEQVYEADLQESAARESKQTSAAAKREARIDHRVQKEHNRIAEIVKARWNLDAKDIDAFVKHSNETGSNRVLRTTKRKFPTSFEQKVYRALVAWVRHTKTDYDLQCQQAKQNAFGELERKREDLGGRPAKRENREVFYDIRKQSLLEFRAGKADAHEDLHKKFTAEAIRWLSERETGLGKQERLARESDVVQRTASESNSTTPPTFPPQSTQPPGSETETEAP